MLYNSKVPLVSIPVITYNSSEYIIKGLDSIKFQTYQNIELIISDDCSSDNTVELCRDWLANNKDRFVRSLLITTEKNTGVAGNCNRAIKPCNGEWIKMLSGDDILLPTTIEDFVEFVSLNNNVNICFGKLKFIGESNERTDKIKLYYNRLFEEIKNPKKQYQRYLKHHYIPGTGLFYKKTLWEKVNGFDEKYPFCEEFPFNLAILESGETVYYMDKEAYGYNIHEGSLSNDIKPVWRNFRDQKKFFKEVKFKKMIKKGYLFHAYDEFVYYYTTDIKYFQTPSKLKNIFIIFLKLLSPLSLVRRIKRYV